jgi:hypothetical protein
MANGHHEQWFMAELATGLQRLISLSLQGTPAMETIQLTAASWAETLWAAPIGWDQSLDSQRIASAFVRMMRDVDRWPAPKHLLHYLPSRPQPVNPLLTAPQISEEQRQRNLSHLEGIVAMFKRGDRNG